MSITLVLWINIVCAVFGLLYQDITKVIRTSLVRVGLLQVSTPRQNSLKYYASWVK